MSKSVLEGSPLPETIDPSTHIFFVACAALVTAFLIWASIGTLDIVSMAQGEVIPSTQVKSIQHLEGGIVREIAVSEGERVKTGQALIVLEPTSSGADVGELKVRITGLRIEIARLMAEAAGPAAPLFDKDLRTGYSDLIGFALKQFRTRKLAQENRITSQKETIIQRRQNIKEISVRIANNKSRLKLHEEQISISEELLKDDLTNRYNHLDLLKTANEIKGRIEEDFAAELSARAALKEAQSRLESIESDYQEEIGKALEEARSKLNEFTERMNKYEDNLQRTVLRAPVDGVIKTLYVTTIGGVIRSGDTVVDIVPGEDRLIIEAKLPTQDIGYVREGQTAVVKLASSDADRFGSLEGVVMNISPDTILTPEGDPFYKVRIKTKNEYFEKGKRRYQLYPGMQVLANIETGNRTVIEYLISPLIYSLGDAMRER